MGFVRESTGETMVAAENIRSDFRENRGREAYGAAGMTSAPSTSDIAAEAIDDPALILALARPLYSGADAQTRTEDLLITNQLLYQLSYISEGAVL